MQKYAAIGCIVLALGIMAGAFGAHALQGTVPDEKLKIFEKAVLYHLVHGTGLILLALIGSAGWLAEGHARGIFWLMLGGAFIFSGSLYLYVILGIRTFAMITPLGGLGMIAAWLTLGVLLWRGAKP